MTDAAKTPKWVALESNPAILTKFARAIGMSKEYSFEDCWGLDPEMLAFVAQPCLAVIFLFPSSKADSLDIKSASKDPVDPSVWYMKQHVKNACGSVAVVHALANNTEKVGITGDASFLAKFMSTSSSMEASERGDAFGVAEGIESVSDAVAKDSSAQTEAPDADAAIDLHFVCFTYKEGGLYELDGRKEGPVRWSSSTPEQFLFDAAKVIKTEYIDKMPGELHFSTIVLGPKQS
eukprot:TRINITY_DN437_c0_g1_i1.p1 TRINITY_DN437_c0_g1~~TRINITY_DN437_c0_g1_i1.p1  ORF type:complete len:256 (+),score=58.06 TRINITY_DN437_c0_g1_i1:65-769(+)